MSLGSVARVLSGMNRSSAASAGPNDLHPHLLKACSVAWSLPFCILFVRSLEDGVLLILWKTSILAPLDKNGLRCDPLNYHPVSLISVCWWNGWFIWSLMVCCLYISLGFIKVEVLRISCW